MQRERERVINNHVEVGSVSDEKYLKAIERLAEGYEYEEVQTLLEDTPTGTKKKVIRTKKHMPPSFQAATYLLKRNHKHDIPAKDPVEVQSENMQKFKLEKF